MPLTLAKDTDVVHNTGDENIEGFKTFEEDLCTVQNVRTIAKAAGKGQFISEYNFVPTTTVFPSFTLRHNTMTLPDENIPVSVLGRFCCTDSQSRIIGGTNVRVNPVNTPITEMVARAYRNGASKLITTQLSMDANGNGTFVFPRCTSRPSTKSTAANNRVAVVNSNYLRDTTGWYTRSDGLIVQWGRGKIPNNANVLTLTFPKKFATANYQFLMNPGTAGSGQPYANQILTYFAVTTSNIKIVCNVLTTSFSWVAIGY